MNKFSLVKAAKVIRVLLSAAYCYHVSKVPFTNDEYVNIIGYCC